MNRKLTNEEIKKFRRKIWGYYRVRGRDFPWRRQPEAYQVLVSELMLQQTQAYRVVEKYGQFMKAFPTLGSLNEASLREVLSVWQGLGYNRRAKFLTEIAHEIKHKYGGELPSNQEKLTSLPGIGKNTAGAILAFTFDQPVVFIETNIRRVFIHEFFPRKKGVKDKFLEEMIRRTLPRKNIREWYYALMDYGVYLSKNLLENPNRKSHHYHQQSSFEGSRRQVRGRILRLLLCQDKVTKKEIVKNLPTTPDDLVSILHGLEKEGIIQKRKNYYQVTENHSVVILKKL